MDRLPHNRMKYLLLDELQKLYLLLYPTARDARQGPYVSPVPPLNTAAIVDVRE